MDMRYLFPAIFLCFLTTSVSGQIKAVTETGDEVILNQDGTWKSATSVTPSYDTRLDTPVFNKDKNATFLLKGTKINYGIWLDPKKWSFKSKKDENSATEYVLTLKKESAYCIVIPEAIQLSLELVEAAAITNGKSAAPDIHIVREETRKINNNIVKNLELRGTIDGTKFVYFGYYYTGPLGTVQVLCYTSESLFPKYKAEMEELLNGFTTKLD